MCPRDASIVAGIWPSRQGQPSGEMFAEGMISDLPAPVRRYFLHAIAPGTPLARSVRLEMTGTFRLARGAPWLLMSAQEILTVPDQTGLGGQIDHLFDDIRLGLALEIKVH